MRVFNEVYINQLNIFKTIVKIQKKSFNYTALHYKK